MLGDQNAVGPVSACLAYVYPVLAGRCRDHLVSAEIGCPHRHDRRRVYPGQHREMGFCPLEGVQLGGATRWDEMLIRAPARLPQYEAWMV
jgi:hypothetical protein